MSNSIEIISWNVNGIRAVGNKEALRWIDEREPDILCLQEIVQRDCFYFDNQPEGTDPPRKLYQ